MSQSRTAPPGRPPTRSGYLSLRLRPEDKARFVEAALRLGISPGALLVDLLEADLGRAKRLTRRRLEVDAEDRRKPKRPRNGDL